MLFIEFTGRFLARIGVIANMPSLSGRFITVAASLALLCALAAVAQTSAHTTQHASKEATMTAHHAVGTFDVKVTPLTTAAGATENPISELSLDKQFHGALEATGKGTMLASGNPANGAGGYVAMEKVTGTLDGRKGSFVLQHSGTMKGGAAEMSVTVVPDSGTDELTGLDGKMTIQIAAGKHSYDFEYTLPAAP